MAQAPQAPLSLLAIDHLLTEEERAIRAVVRDFVDTRIKPEVADWFETGHIPARELALEFGELGLLGMHLGAMDAPAQARCPTDWLRWSWKLAILASGLWSAFKVHSRCMRSMLSVHQNTRSSGFPEWRRGNSSAALG